LHTLDLGYETATTVLEKKNIMKHNFQQLNFEGYFFKKKSILKNNQKQEKSIKRMRTGYDIKIR
jgi:hypothetical protein